ncbi:hypothetical protein E2C01_092086 [Portunus trituberculatus]|uniref:Uncharacterized protein n=1 Tax=Portunus trituberculatus TaxID=210409 RepID=A0A5B7JUV6_PORTR|nr:hypothetical protein [Portunus trituberculatus]
MSRWACNYAAGDSGVISCREAWHDTTRQGTARHGTARREVRKEGKKERT